MNNIIDRQQFREKLTSWQKDFAQHNECGGCEAELLEKVIKEYDAQQKGCVWCNADENGEYSMSLFKNPNNPEQEATLSVYGGQIVMEIRMSASTPPARMAVKINHCPMCGRRFEDGEE